MTEPRTIREITSAGDHYQRGLQRGEMVRDTFTPPPVPDVTGRFVRACFDLTAEFHPSAVDEFEGIVRGGGFEREAMMAYCFARVAAQPGGCTMAAVSESRRKTGSGPIAGRNYDWAVSDLRWCALHRLTPPDGPRRIGFTNHWAGCPDWLSERGLYAAMAALPAADVRCPGVQWNVLLDRIAETCSTADAAAGLCAGVRHLRSMSYLFADAGGGMCVVEAMPAHVRRRDAADGALVATNAPLGGRLLADRAAVPCPADAALHIELESPQRRLAIVERAMRRQRRAEALLREAAEDISRRTMTALLRDHEAPICVCADSDPGGHRWGTIWSGICDPAEGAFLIAPGAPCRHAFQRFTL